MAVELIVVNTIPRGGIVVLPGIPEADRPALRAELEAAAEHDRFAVVWLESDAGPVGVVAPEEVQRVLRASMADEVRSELISEARRAAREVVSQNRAPDAAAETTAAPAPPGRAPGN